MIEQSRFKRVAKETKESSSSDLTADLRAAFLTEEPTRLSTHLPH